MSDSGGDAGEDAREARSAADQDAELRRLRSEVSDLRARLAAGVADRPRRTLGVRRWVAAVLVVLAAFGVVASTIGVWGARTTFNTDRWVATVAPLPRQPEVNAAMATYISDQVFSALQVQERIGGALPPKAAFLAAPVSGAVHDHVRERVQRFMSTEQFAVMWEAANRYAHSQIKAIAQGQSRTVTAQNGTVALNMLPVINDVIVTISNELPTLFGKKLELPVLTSGRIPPDLRTRVQSALGVPLPADFGQMTIYRHDQLTGLQDAVLLFKRSVILLVLGTLLLLAAAVAVSPHRRRTIFQFGMALAVGAVTVATILRAVRNQVLERVPEGVYRDGAAAAAQEFFRVLRERGDQLLWAGVAIALLAYLVGPGRVPVLLRGYARRGVHSLTQTTTIETIRDWTARHLDVLRISGVVVAALIALLLVSWTALLAILIVLAAFEVAVTLLARNVGTLSRAPAPPDP